MLWDDEQRKFVDGGTTKTSLDDPCLQGLTITPQEVIERIRKAKGGGGRLDLTGIGLRRVPDEVWTLTDLADLQLSNNKLTALPDAIGNLKNVERLGLAGNRLRKLPDGIGNCVRLEGLWAHGNLLRNLPSTIEQCESVRTLMLAGNRLQYLPPGLGNLADLEELSVPGNRLGSIPESIVTCVSLRTIDLHGNAIQKLPSDMGTKCRSLEDIAVQGNLLTEVPDSLCDARRLKRLNVAENLLETLPEKLGDAMMLNQLWVYANPELKSLPQSLARNVSLKEIWAEGCAFDEDKGKALSGYIQYASEGGGGKRKGLPATLGVDTDQLLRAGINKEKTPDFVKVSEVSTVSSWVAGGAPTQPRGYFKHDRWKVNSKFRSEGGEDETSPILIVAFGSAPGVPNWGGLLKKLKLDITQRGLNNVGGAGAGAAAAVHCAKVGFDVLYVCDSTRSWYGGDGFENQDMGEKSQIAWRAAIGEVSKRYEKVIHLGDSMGASAALLFADLADCSLAFCPQVDLVEASIRPGRSAPWMKQYERAMIAAVNRCVQNKSNVFIHTGTWQHDMDQAGVVCETLSGGDSVVSYSSEAGGTVKITTHHVDNHRLALALEQGGELLPIVRTALHEQLKGLAKDGDSDSSSSSSASASGVDDIALKKFNPAVRGV